MNDKRKAWTALQEHCEPWFIELVKQFGIDITGVSVRDRDGNLVAEWKR